MQLNSKFSEHKSVGLFSSACGETLYSGARKKAVMVPSNTSSLREVPAAEKARIGMSIRGAYYSLSLYSAMRQLTYTAPVLKD